MRNGPTEKVMNHLVLDKSLLNVAHFVDHSGTYEGHPTNSQTRSLHLTSKRNINRTRAAKKYSVVWLLFGGEGGCLQRDPSGLFTGKDDLKLSTAYSFHR
jgi:hypothetical protein